MRGKFDYFSTLTANILPSASEGPFRKSIIGYNINTRTVAWSFDVREIGKYYGTIDKEWIEGFASDVKVVKNNIYVLTQPNLICVDAQTGNMLWRKDVKSDCVKKITYSDSTDEILLFDSEEFYFIDAKTGHLARNSTQFYQSFKQMGLISTNST